MTIGFRTQVLNFSSADQGLFIRVPGTVAQFATPTGPLKFFYNPQNLSIGPAGWAYENYSAVVLSAAATFNSSAPAQFSSQLLAVMTQLPWSSVALRFQWQYVLTDPNGSSFASGYGGSQGSSQVVVPAEYAVLSSTSPLTMTSGRSFTACLSGTVLGRTFSLHAETLVPFNDFAAVNATIPTTTALPFCWSVFIPTWVTPQKILIHLWDYENPGTSNVTTLLLYLRPVQIISGSPSNSFTFLGVPLAIWLAGVSAGIVVIAVGTIGYSALRRRAQRTSPPAREAAHSAAQPVFRAEPPSAPEPRDVRERRHQ